MDHGRVLIFANEFLMCLHCDIVILELECMVIILQLTVLVLDGSMYECQLVLSVGFSSNLESFLNLTTETVNLHVHSSAWMQ